MSLPSLAEVEHADWPTLVRICASLGLNPKGRSEVVRMRVLDHVRRRVHPEAWRPAITHQAALLTRLGHPDASVRLWETAMRLDEPAPWVGLGSAQLGAGDLTEASKAFDRAIQMGDASASLHRAESLAASGNYEGAVRACDAYLASRPRDLRALVLKAIFLARGGWADESAVILRDAFETHPDLRELWRGLGTLMLKSGRSEAAAEAYREALRADPEDETSWINRGASLLLAGRTHEAIGAFREVLERDPRQAVALNDLGVAYLREGQPKAAAVNLERAAKHMETPQVLRNVAKAQEATHQKAAALDSYARLLALEPRDAQAVAARKRLGPPRPLRRAAGLRARRPPRRKRKAKGRMPASARKPRPRPKKAVRARPKRRARRETRRAPHRRKRLAERAAPKRRPKAKAKPARRARRVVRAKGRRAGRR